MIEELLRKESATSKANSDDIYDSLVGETIDAAISGCVTPGDRGCFTIFVFRSGYSFIQHSAGGYWVDDKQRTKETLETQLERLKSDHAKYAYIYDILQNL